MISRRQIYQLSQFACDLAALTGAWYGAVLSRVFLNPFARAPLSFDTASQWAPPLGWILLFWIISSFLFRLYMVPIRTRALTSIRRAGESALMVLLITSSVMYFAADTSRDKSRTFMLLFSPLNVMLLAASRFAAHRLSVSLARRLPPGGYIAVFGDCAGASDVIRRLGKQPEWIFVRGIILPHAARPEGQTTLPILGTAEDLPALVNRERIGQIVLANSGLSSHDVELCVEVCARMGIVMSLAKHGGDAANDSDSVVDVLSSTPTHWQGAVKRVIDVVGASAALLLLSPVFALIAVLVKTTSAGPLLYCSPRVGKGGRYFTFLKFRSMYVGRSRSMVASSNEKDGHIFKIKRDPRVTPVGRILRRLSLDELPQLINVLRGDMSLVGPRPLPAEDLGPDGMSTRFVIWSKQRSQTRPGITGLWQIRGRSNLPFDDMIRYDQEYVRNWSLLKDLVILAKTPLLVVLGDGAY